MNLKQKAYIDFAPKDKKKHFRLRLVIIYEISKYKNIFSSWSAELFVIKEVKDATAWEIMIGLHLNRAIGTFYKQELQNKKQSI